MKKRFMKRGLSLLLALAMVFGCMSATVFAEMGTKPADSTTTDQPFASGTGGSTNFRIPALVTTYDAGGNEIIVAASDARWNHAGDACGLDTVVSWSDDAGANWHYTFANYLGDNGNQKGLYSTAFIDPELAYDEAKNTIYMLVDLFPGGYAINTAPDRPQTGSAFTEDGYLKIKAAGDTTYDYYLKDGNIYGTDGTAVEHYTVDGKFNLLYDGAANGSNLFFRAADGTWPEYQVYPTTYLYLTKSTDNGKTWSDPQLLNVKKDTEYFYGTGPGRGVVTEDGTIIFSCYVYSGTASTQRSSFIYSTDGGESWNRTDDATSIQSSESQAVDLGNGTLRVFFRNANNCICYVDATKTDSGYTWGEVVRTSVSNHSDCQLSAIKYSKKIAGKDAILVSCPTVSGRNSGKIFVGLLNDDKTMDWSYTYAGFGTGKFQYSCLTELSDGSIGILYENGDSSIVYDKVAIEEIVEDAVIGSIWLADETGDTVSNSITIKPGESVTLNIAGTPEGNLQAVCDSEAAEVSFDETNHTITLTAKSGVTGLESALLTVTDGISVIRLQVDVTSVEQYEHVTLHPGETAAYTDRTGDYSDTDLSGVDTGVATVTVTGDRLERQQAQLATGVAAFGAEKIELDDCLYTFEAAEGNNVYTISATAANGTKVYLHHKSGSNAGIPNKNESAAITVAANAGSFSFNDDGSYLYFWKTAGNSGQNLYFDRNGSAAANCYFELYQKSADAPEDSPIAGYQKLTSLSAITAGGQYLIAVQAGDGNYYLLYPSTGTSNFNHVAKVGEIPVTERKSVAQLATSAGNFNGSQKALSRCLYTFTSTGETNKYAVSAQTSDGTTVHLNLATNGQLPNKAAGRTYQQITVTDPGQIPAGRYLIRTTHYNGSMGVMGKTATTSDNTQGLNVQSVSDFTNTDLSAYFWDFAVVDGGYTIQDVTSGQYINISGDNVALGENPQTFTIVNSDEGTGIAISYDDSGTTRYLNNYGSNNSIIATWTGNDAGSNLYLYQEAQETIAIEVKEGATAGTFKLYDTVNSRHLHFYNNNLYFDRCGTTCGPADDFELYKQSENAPGNSPIEGYEKVNSRDGIENGGSYLIVRGVSNGDSTDYYVMYPYSGGSNFNHVAKVANVEPNVAGSTEITIEGVAEGNTSVKIGETTYFITVLGDETNLTLGIGEEYFVEGALVQDSTEPGIVQTEVGSRYEKLSGSADVVPGQYLIAKDRYVMVNEEVSVSGEPKGLNVHEVSDFADEDLSAYLWTLTAVEGGYTIQDENGKYVNIGEDTNNVTLSDTPQTLEIVANGDGIGIKYGSRYLNNYGGDYDNIAAYPSNGEGSRLYLYRKAEGVTITGETTGTTTMKIGATTYHITVVYHVESTLFEQLKAIAAVMKDEEDYTEESREALALVLTEAEQLTYTEDGYSTVAGGEAKQAEIDEMTERLLQAIYGLVRNTQSITVTVGETITRDVSGELSGDIDEAIASVAVAESTMTITGNQVGIMEVTVGNTGYTITVIPKQADAQIKIGASNDPNAQGAGQIITKLTISADVAFDLDIEGENVTWSSADEELLTIDENGTITCTGTTTGMTTVTATVDGSSYTIPVTVLEAPTAENKKLYNIYIDEISDVEDGSTENMDVYYAWDCETELTHACEKELIYVNRNANANTSLDFMGAPLEGYALTYMAATGSRSHYMTVHTGDDVTLDESENGFLNYPDGAGVKQSAIFTKARVMAMLQEALYKKCDGVLGFTRPSNDSGDVNSSLTFRSRKLPTVEKKVLGIIGGSGKYRTYTEGMTASLGERILFAVTVRCYGIDNTGETISFENMILTDTMSQGKGQVWFVDPDAGEGQQENGKPVKDISADFPQTTSETFTETYYVIYKIVKEDFEETAEEEGSSGVDLLNHIDLTYTYQANYSTGAFSDSYGDDAEIIATNFLPGDYVVDFGLPLTIEFTETGKHTVDGVSKSGKSDSGAADVELLEDNKVKYTLTKPLQGIDTVKIYDGELEFFFSVIPANSVYYEENFMEYTEGWTQGGALPTAPQEAAQPGDTQLEADPAANYGYDTAYTGTGESANSELYTAATTDGKEKGTFTFTGTGVDVYANCDKDTGIAMVMIRKVNEDGTTALKKVITVDTILNPGAIDTTAGLGDCSETRNVPIVSIPEGGLEHGAYEVMIVHVPKKIIEEDQQTGEKTTTEVATKLRIDGFRVYGTLKGGDTLTYGEELYGMDNESYSKYFEMRDSLLAGWNVSNESEGSSYAEQLENAISQIHASGTDKLAGAVLINGTENTDNAKITYTGENLKDFLDNSSKNELYLYPGQSLVFKLDYGTVNPQIALKALNAEVTYKMIVNSAADAAEKTMTANTELYYPLTMNTDETTGADGTTFTISNTGTTGILAVTKLKTSNPVISDTASAAVFAEVTRNDLMSAMVSLGYTTAQAPDPTPGTEPEASVTDIFADVAKGQWYVDAIQHVYDAQVMSGNGDKFTPNGRMTRAMFVTALYRMEGEPEITDYRACEELKDVSADAWYTDAVCWAYSTEITTGYSDTMTFGMNDPLTREQLATFLYRYAQYKELNVSQSNDLSDLLNADKVKAYAKDALQWAVGAGLINGQESKAENGVTVYDLAPQQTATRAQLASILMRFEEAYNQ